MNTLIKVKLDISQPYVPFSTLGGNVPTLVYFRLKTHGCEMSSLIFVSVSFFCPKESSIVNSLRVYLCGSIQ